MKTLHQTSQCQLIPIGAEAADDRQCRVGERGMPPLGLARKDVGDVQLDEGHPHADERVANGKARVGVRRRVHHRAVDAAAKSLHRVDHLTFSVVLREAELDTELFRHLQQARLDVRKRRCPIKLGLTGAEEIEIWTIDDGDLHSPVSPSSQARNLATSSSDSCAAGTRGFTLGVGIGGVGGVVLGAPAVPLNAPASRDAARLSAGLTDAPAKTASSVALGTAPPSGTAWSGCDGGAAFEERAGAAGVAERGGRRRPSVAKNSLIEGWRAASEGAGVSAGARSRIGGAGDTSDAAGSGCAARSSASICAMRSRSAWSLGLDSASW